MDAHTLGLKLRKGFGGGENEEKEGRQRLYNYVTIS